MRDVASWALKYNVEEHLADKRRYIECVMKTEQTAKKLMLFIMDWANKGSTFLLPETLPNFCVEGNWDFDTKHDECVIKLEWTVNEISLSLDVWGDGVDVLVKNGDWRVAHKWFLIKPPEDITEDIAHFVEAALVKAKVG